MILSFMVKTEHNGGQTAEPVVLRIPASSIGTSTDEFSKERYVEHEDGYIRDNCLFSENIAI